MNKPGRNDPCPCGSGKKYKHCCERRETPPAGGGPDTSAAALQAALGHHRAGRLPQAQAIYQQILQVEPNHPDALHYQGVIASAQGRQRDAAELIGRAIRVRPSRTMHFNLGNALKALGSLDEAAGSYRAAIALKPDYAEAHVNLGNALRVLGNPCDAAEHYRSALALKPDLAEAHHSLGVTLRSQGDHGAAVACLRRALALKPDWAEAHNDMGGALKNLGQLDEALKHYRIAVSLQPDFPDAHNNLGSLLRVLGDLNAAIACYRRALALKPDLAEAYSNLLFLYGYHATLDSAAYLALARGWERACVPEEERRAARGRILSRPALRGRRLKVGYLSGDYRQHSVSYFVEQLFAHHNRARVELFAYSNHGQRDAVTERLQALVEHWIPVSATPDTAVCDRIGADGIDVLVDLSGHTAHNRLGVFARRAAPVQAHYLGYFASTGLNEMDYWIGDATLIPPEADSHFSETVWRLPRVWVCYDGKADAPPTAWCPDPDGAVWVGSFNNLAKLTPATLALWAKVLRALPQGKLLLKTKELADPGNRRRILDEMAGHGVAPERVELLDAATTPGWAEHLARYDRLDIALDPVGGVGGGTTTCDALWMGAPVITLEGDRMASRMTASMLDAIGHPEWVARSEAEYVEKVVALARDVEKRKPFRESQRGKMAASPLCDARGLAESLENAYFEMFERWHKEKNST
jgi:predicted O-linked N-acetylglucosamine transferase (SPINDLY family)